MSNPLVELLARMEGLETALKAAEDALKFYSREWSKKFATDDAFELTSRFRWVPSTSLLHDTGKTADHALAAMLRAKIAQTETPMSHTKRIKLSGSDAKTVINLLAQIQDGTIGLTHAGETVRLSPEEQAVITRIRADAARDLPSRWASDT
jgi:hypothetical protein